MLICDTWTISSCSIEILKNFRQWRFIQAIRKIEGEPTPFPMRPHRLAPPLAAAETQAKVASANAHLGLLVHANTFRFREKALKTFIENTREHRGIDRELADAWSPFGVKKGYRAIQLR